MSGAALNLTNPLNPELTTNQIPPAQQYSSWTSYLPGLSIIRTHVINPLLIATEKVVEQYIPIQEQDTPSNNEIMLQNDQFETGQSQ